MYLASKTRKEDFFMENIESITITNLKKLAKEGSVQANYELG